MTGFLNVSGSEVGNGNDKGVGFGVADSKKYVKKSRELFKSQKLFKSRKNLSKRENLSKFGTKKAGPYFLTSDAKKTFNCLWLAFLKSPLFTNLIWNITLRLKRIHCIMQLMRC